jgi:hypothetical protein
MAIVQVRLTAQAYGAGTAFLAALLCIGLSPAARAESDGLARAIEQTARMVVPDGTVVLAASASQEGHWTFINAKGERFTAASPDEMKRMPGVLAPAAKDTETRLVLVLTEDTVFSQASALAALPRPVTLRLSTALGIYPLHDGPPRVAQLSPKIRAEIGQRAAFDEILAQLDRSVARKGIRVVALQSGAPAILLSRPVIDKSGKPELIEPIDPYRLRDALPALRGQTVLVTGRLADGLLYFQVSGGPDRSLIAADLVDAAERCDVNLIILDTPSGRQPGARNWLWLKAELSGADAWHADSGLDGLLATLATDARPLTVRLTKATADRVTMVAVPSAVTSSASGGIVDALTRAALGVTNDVTGRIEPAAIHMHLVSASRQREWDSRLVRWLPASATWGYLALALLGLAGIPASWRWWNKLWPPENRGEYANAFGYQAARVVKLVIYAIVFMPLTAMAAAPVALLAWLKPSPQPA